MLNKCSICKKEVVWHEHHGWLHWNKKEKRGIYPSQDKSGHSAASKW